MYWSDVLLPIVAFEVYPDVALELALVGNVNEDTDLVAYVL